MNSKKIILIFSLLATFLFGNAQNWDIDIAKNINPENPNSGYWKAMSGSAYYISAAVPVSLLVTGLIENNKDFKRKSYEIFSAIVIELAVSEAMKISIDRQRPAEKYPGEVFPYKNIYGRSFPSGHTSLAFATAASLSIQFKKWYVVVPAYLWAGSVGYSRIYLGVHYPSDVLGGAIVGIGSAYLSHWLNKQLFKRE
jgi:membrane-associated phospholipid phosphatase